MRENSGQIEYIKRITIISAVSSAWVTLMILETVSSLVVQIPVLFIFSYGQYRSQNPTYIDPLMLGIGVGDLDGWSITHFCWFGLMGYLFPTKAIEVLGMGAVWEGTEWCLGEVRPAVMGGFGDCPNNINAKRHEKWWYGRFSDLIINTLGFFTIRAFFV